MSIQGLKIETDHRLKCLSEETLVEIGENKYLDHNFFISRAMTLPPDITEFDVKACWHLTTSATTTSLGGYIFVIAKMSFGMINGWLCLRTTWI